MAKQVQLRRGTTAQHASFTGAAGEVTVDTDKGVVVVHDGSTAGGIPGARDSTVLKQGKTTIWIPAVAMMPRVTNGPSRGVTELATNDIMLPTLDFDTTTEEGAGFWIRMPKAYNAGTVTFSYIWTAASGSGGVVFSLAGRAFADDDAMDQAVGTVASRADTFITANDMHVATESGTITLAGTPAAEIPVYFQITRTVANGSDTLAVDAKLIGVFVHFTTNAATDA
jgi:hypothetical protein